MLGFTHLGTAFFMFSLVVIPTLLLMGLITFERLLQAATVDGIYARGINRIRHLYLEYAPQMQPYFIHSTHDDQEGTLGAEAMHPSWWQVFLNMAGMIAVINSVLADSFVGLLLAAFTFPLWVSTSAGVVTFLLSLALMQRYQWRQWMHADCLSQSYQTAHSCRNKSSCWQGEPLRILPSLMDADAGEDHSGQADCPTRPHRAVLRGLRVNQARQVVQRSYPLNGRRSAAEMGERDRRLEGREGARVQLAELRGYWRCLLHGEAEWPGRLVPCLPLER